jgi:type VI protein secretion system component VasF
MRLDDQRQSIEVERQSLAAARQREPIVAEAIGAAALLLAALLPLLLAAYALRQLKAGSTDEAVKEVLVRELVEGPLLTERPTSRLAGQSGNVPPRLEQQAPGDS